MSELKIGIKGSIGKISDGGIGSDGGDEVELSVSDDFES